MPDKYISPIRQEIEKRKKQQSSSSKPSAVSSAYVSPIRQEINKRREETKQARAMSPNEQARRSGAQRDEAALNKAGKSLIPASSKPATQSEASRIEAKMNSLFESPSNPAAKPTFTGSAKFAQDHPTFTKIMTTLTDPIHSFLDDTKPGQFLSAISESGADMATGGASAQGRQKNATTGNTTADTIAHLIGGAAGLVVNPGGAPSLGNAMGKSSAAAEYGLNKAGVLAQNAQKTLQETGQMTPLMKATSKLVNAGYTTKTAQAVAKGIGAGVPFSASQQINEFPNKSAGQVVSDIAGDSILFGLGDGALSLAGRGLAKTTVGQKAADLFNRFTQRDKPVEVTKQPLLALPAPKEVIARNPEAYRVTKPLTPYDDAVGKEINQWAGVNRQYEPVRQTTTETINRLARPKPLGDLKLVNPAERQLASLYKLAEENGAPPGREYEYLQDLWSSVAPKEAGSFDNLIEQATKTRSMDEIVSNMKNHINEMEKYGFSPLDTLKGRVKRTPEVHTTTRITNPDPNFQLRGGPMVPVGKPYTVKSTKELLAESKPQVAEAKPLNVPNAAEVVAPAAKLQEAAQKLKKPATATNERGFVTTLKNSPKSQGGFVERLKAAYKPITNEETVAAANKRVSGDIEKASSYVMSAKKATAEHVATAHRLIDEFQKQGNYERAVQIAEKIAEQGTKAGQSIQAFSIYNRLSPEGILVHASRVANKVNEKLPVGQAEVKVTDEMAAHLTDLASTVQKMKGTKEVANNVMHILEKAKTGEKLTDFETQQIKNFVKEARQFVKEANPKPPKPPKPTQNKKVRDNVVSFLEAQEKAALKRIQDKKSRLNAIPVDLYADYAVVGATKMAKGAIKFVDWSEQMVKDFGEEIRPHLETIYEKAKDTLGITTKEISSRKLSQVERITEKVINNKNISEKDAAMLRDMAGKVTALSGDAKNIASQDLQAVLQSIEKPGILQKISTGQAIMQLLNPKTLVRNALGNEIFYRLERINKLIATPIDMGRVALFGGKRSVTFKTNNQGEYWKNWMKGFQAGLKGVNPEGISTQFDLRPNSFNAKWNPLTYLEKALGASLQSFDYAGYKRAVNQTLGEMATLDAVNQGLKGEAKKAHIEQFIRNADENLLAIADKYGKYVTFQDNNALSMALVGFKRALNAKKEFGIGDLVLKYPKTPGALVMRALEYSPAGFLRSAYILSGPLFKREPNTAEVMLSLSRAILGTTGLTGLGWFLAEKGVLTGASSKDKDVRELQSAAGEGQYRVNFTALKRLVTSGFNEAEAKMQEGDTLISYDWAQPIAIALSMGANASQKTKEGKDATTDLAGTAYDSVDGAMNTLVDQSVLSGIKKAFSSTPGQDGVMDKLKDIASGLPASFVPTLSNQINQLSDNAKRETYSPDKLQAAINKLKVKVPGKAQELPQQYTTLGQPKEVYQNGSNNLFNVFLNPSFVSKYQLSPEAKMVVDLIDETGDTSAAPRAPGKTITLKGNSYKLTSEEYSQLQRRQGEETLKRLQRINPNASNTSKLKRVAKALEDAGKKARKEIEREHPEIQRKR